MFWLEVSLFISITFPVADFRSLHVEEAGRLSAPKWGEHDPQAKFVRGFGAIHTRNKSGIGFVGENYYSDCNNLVRFPEQTFVSALSGENDTILLYPVYRRFFFDGIISGRFEFGFRLNMPTIDALEMHASYHRKILNFDAIAASRQALSKNTKVHIPDGRVYGGNFLKIAEYLRDSYIISSTKNAKLSRYDIASVGVNYVSVGHPYVILRAGKETPVQQSPSGREIFSGDFQMFGERTGHHGREIDAIILASNLRVTHETGKERFARLFYSQMRALSYAHSFYLRQLDAKRIAGSSSLKPAVAAMVERLGSLVPLNNDQRDAETCLAMSEIVRNSDVDTGRLTEEIQTRLTRKWPQRLFPSAFKFLDKKVDIAIEAAASITTKHVLGGGL